MISILISSGFLSRQGIYWTTFQIISENKNFPDLKETATITIARKDEETIIFRGTTSKYYWKGVPYIPLNLLQTYHTNEIASKLGISKPLALLIRTEYQELITSIKRSTTRISSQIEKEGLHGTNTNQGTRNSNT